MSRLANLEPVLQRIRGEFHESPGTTLPRRSFVVTVDDGLLTPSQPIDVGLDGPPHLTPLDRAKCKSFSLSTC